MENYIYYPLSVMVSSIYEFFRICENILAATIINREVQDVGDDLNLWCRPTNHYY